MSRHSVLLSILDRLNFSQQVLTNLHSRKENLASIVLHLWAQGALSAGSLCQESLVYFNKVECLLHLSVCWTAHTHTKSHTVCVEIVRWA